MLMSMTELSLCGGLITVEIGQDRNIKMVDNGQLWFYKWSKITKLIDFEMIFSQKNHKV